MSETKWTPGPWTVDTNWSQTNGADYDIAEQIGDEDSEEAKANAHLIAAAPELYEALDNMTSIAAGLVAILHGKNPEDGVTAAFMDREYPSIRAAINLLAKARGEA